MRTFILVFMLILIVSPAFAQEPLSFKDIKMGMTKDEIKSKLLWYDCPYNELYNEIYRYCISDAIVKGIKVHVLYLFGIKNTLVKFRFTFEPSDYSIFKETLIEKYGETKIVVKEVLQNRMGASFQNEALVWNLESGRITIIKYAYSLDKGRIVFDSKESIEAEKEKEKHEKTLPGF